MRLPLLARLDAAARQASHMLGRTMLTALSSAFPIIGSLTRRDLFVLALSSANGRNGLPWVPDPESGSLRPMTPDEWAAAIVEEAELLAAATDIGPFGDPGSLLTCLKLRRSVQAGAKQDRAAT